MPTFKGTHKRDDLIGTDRGDLMFGLEATDRLIGGKGNDTLKGGGGADALFGDDGIDTADYGDSKVGVQVSLKVGKGGGGTAEGDRLYEVENLTGSTHNDILEGDKKANVLSGGVGDDVLKGGGGADRLEGGAGNDQLNCDGRGDAMNGGAGIDTAYFKDAKFGVIVHMDAGFLFSATEIPASHPKSASSPNPPSGEGERGEVLGRFLGIEHIKGSNHDDRIEGSSGDNNLYGYGGSDVLQGGAGKDAINGGAGADIITGGAGNDVLIGGADADTFVFTGKTSGPNDMGKDVIKGFVVGEDHIMIDSDVLNLGTSMDQVGKDVVVTLDADTAITIQNVDAKAMVFALIFV